jgi:biopolymer transport protein ExbD
MALRINEGDDLEISHEINVTPFIDVMLVLLIIFMVAAPLSTVTVPVDLPAASSQPEPAPQNPITVSLKSDLSLMLGDTPAQREMLGARIDAITHGDKTRRIFVRADKRAPYGDVMQVLNALRAADYTRVSLVALQQS